MKALGETALAVAQSPQQLTRTLRVSSERLAMSAKHAKLLLGCYRAGDANDPEVYTAAIIAILSDYPEDIQQTVTDPRSGLPSRVQWLPTPKEVKDACEAERRARARAGEWERRSKLQLEERAKIDALHAQPRETWDQTTESLAARGFKFSRKQKTDPGAAEIMARYGISRAQWDLIPDLPPDIEVTAKT